MGSLPSARREQKRFPPRTRQGSHTQAWSQWGCHPSPSSRDLRPSDRPTPFWFLKPKCISIRALWGRVLFLQEWVCLLSFFLFETISFVPLFFPSWILMGPRVGFCQTLNIQTKNRSKIFLSRKPAGSISQAFLPHPLGISGEAAPRPWADARWLRFLFCPSPHLDSG